MKARSFMRIDGLGLGSLHVYSAFRTVVEPLCGVLLTIGLVCTLIMR